MQLTKALTAISAMLLSQGNIAVAVPTAIHESTNDRVVARATTTYTVEVGNHSPRLVARTDFTHVATYIGSACGTGLVVERFGKWVWNEKIPSAQKEDMKKCAVKLYMGARQRLHMSFHDQEQSGHDLESGGHLAENALEVLQTGAGAAAGVSG
ncbi:hypothetical protein ANO11243_091020 [Dothideomycetidae sp. 11243]|nr:hypothetical protein ANO11243_091020 [fungal sp. No.11243]